MVRVRFLIFTILIGTILSCATVIGGTVKADQFDQQIQALQNQNANKLLAADRLAAAASSYQQAVDILSQKIASLQNSIVSTQSEIDSLQKQIEAAQAQLEQQKQVLGDNIRAMYLESDITTLEILASSKNLSDYVNKEQYRNSVADKIKSTLDEVNALKAKLQSQQDEQKTLLQSLQSQQNDLQGQQNQKTELLNDTEAKKSVYDEQIKSNNSKIASLKEAQAAEMAARFGGAPGSGPACGGGYPGVWCDAPQDSLIDNWGMYNRECVSYAAWAMAVKYGHTVPYGMGNANQWPSAAASYGIPEGSTPRVGSVAIWYVGAFGHAMVVDYVYADGSFLVSQYNYSFNGTYSTMVVPANSGFTFIYFR